MKVKEVIKNHFFKLKSNSKNIPRNFSTSVVGSEGSFQCQKIPCSDYTCSQGL